MKITKYLFLAGISAIVLSSCSKLGKLTDENFTVVPTPLEVIGGEVPATINGTFPVKYMKKKAEVTVTPVLKYNGGEVIGQSATFQGEKVEGNGTTISYKMGGVYTMKANFAYEDAMLNSDLYARFDAKLGNKVVSIPEVKIGYGVVATSQLLSRCGMTASTAPDAFQRIIEQKQEANIKFLINQANLRASELNTVSIKDLGKILREINDNEETRALQNIEVSAYASPDGKLSFNETAKPMSDKRADEISVTFSDRTDWEDKKWTYDEEKQQYTTDRFENDVMRDNILILEAKTSYVTKENYEGPGGASSVTYCDYDMGGGKGKLISQGTVMDIKWQKKNGKLLLIDTAASDAATEKAAQEAAENPTKDEEGNIIEPKPVVVEAKLNKGKTWIGWISNNHGGKVDIVGKEPAEDEGSEISGDSGSEE